MTQKKRISIAIQILRSKGYIVIAESPNKGLDIVAVTSTKDSLVFIAVMPLGSNSIPMNPFSTKARRARKDALCDAAQRWLDDSAWDGETRNDAVLVQDVGGRSGLIIHTEGITKSNPYGQVLTTSAIVKYQKPRRS